MQWDMNAADNVRCPSFAIATNIEYNYFLICERLGNILEFNYFGSFNLSKVSYFT